MPSPGKLTLFKNLPSTDEILRRPEIHALKEREGIAAVGDAVRAALGRLRDEIADDRLDGKSLDLALSGLSSAIERELRHSLRYSLRPSSTPPA